MWPTRMVKYLRILPAPLLVGLAGLALLWLLSRWDGAQTARLAELDRQDRVAVAQTLAAARHYKATQTASEAARREIARLRARDSQLAARTVRLTRLADSLTARLTPTLAALPDSVAAPIRLALAAKDSVIQTQAERIHGLLRIVDSLGENAARWEGEAALQRNLAQRWQDQATAWRKEARRSCWPVVGCVNRTLVALAAAGVGFALGSR